MRLGYSIDEIVKASMETENLRSEIHASVAGRKWDTVNALSERFGRVFLRHQKENRKTSIPSIYGREGGLTSIKMNATVATTA